MKSTARLRSGAVHIAHSNLATKLFFSPPLVFNRLAACNVMHSPNDVLCGLGSRP